nr:hypothetical protein [Tanacetum cinerariifolium]
MDEALVPHARRLRIGRSNFRLLSDIKSMESTLQLVYDVLRLTSFSKAFLVTANVLKIYMQEFWVTTTVHHHSIRFKMDNKKHIVNLESFREMLHICPRLPVATRTTPPKPKASVQKTRSSFDTTITPPTVAASLRLTTSEKGKQAAKASKAKSLSALSELCLLVAVIVSNRVTTVQKGAAGGGYHYSKCKVKSVMFILLRDDCIITNVGDKYDLKEKCNRSTDLQVMSK